jgi:hypothetical protein
MASNPESTTRNPQWWFYPYASLLIGAILFMLRRLVLPTVFELEGVPFGIAVGSALNACYVRPSLSSCGDGIIVLLTGLGVALGAGWGSLGRTIFALILVILPLGLYFAYSPLWLWLPLLILLPVVLEFGARLLAPFL